MRLTVAKRAIEAHRRALPALRQSVWPAATASRCSVLCNRALSSSAGGRRSLSTVESTSDELFADTDTAFASKTLPQLLRGILVFKVCGVRAVVTRADELVSFSNRVFGTRL